MIQKSEPQLYDWLSQHEVQHVPTFNEQAILDWGSNPANIIAHHTSYFQNVHAPDSPGPIEKHPYIGLYLDSFDLKRTTLLLGTFPPSTYMNAMELPGFHNANVVANIPLRFFYGNMAALWDYLFDLRGDQINVEAIREQLAACDISISDVFEFVQRRKLASSDDGDYRNILVNRQLVEILSHNSSVETVLFTSGKLSGLHQNATNTLSGFKWFLKDWYNENGGTVEISGGIDGEGIYHPINLNALNEIALAPAVADQNGGIIWWLRVNGKKLRVINLPSPSPGANMGMYGTTYFLRWVLYVANQFNLPLPDETQRNSLAKLYLPLYPGVFGVHENYLAQYRREVYHAFLTGTIDLI